MLLRRTFRDGPKVRNETVANLSMLPEAAIAALEASKPTTSTYAPSTTGCLSASKPTY
ncbi:hypothetical protein [Mycobacterium kansasii]|uniref:hypothetical protein n=1 Tax=Mycobacterium kansasii TaxID=1768 RepID=UPI003A8501DF